MFGFTQFLPTGPAFPQCTACSSPVIQLFKVWISLTFRSPIPQSRQIDKLFLPSSELGLLQPLPAGECAVHPPFPPGGGGSHSLGGKGAGESKFRRGDVHCGTLWPILSYLSPFSLSFSLGGPKYKNQCSAQTRTGMGLLGKPPAEKQFPTVKSHLVVGASYATRRKRKYEANKCGWTQPLFRKARDRGIN